jgi:hypothetical protein
MASPAKARKMAEFIAKKNAQQAAAQRLAPMLVPAPIERTEQWFSAKTQSITPREVLKQIGASEKPSYLNGTIRPVSTNPMHNTMTDAEYTKRMFPSWNGTGSADIPQSPRYARDRMSLFNSSKEKWGKSKIENITSAKSSGVTPKFIMNRKLNNISNRAVSGIVNQARSIFNTVAKGFNAEKAFNIGGRAAIGMGMGMGAGLLLGGIGNLINPDIVSTDEHKVRNAMLIGATAGALGMASGAAGTITKSLNKNILSKPWLQTGAKLTQKIANSKATVGALGVAAIAAGTDTHFCRSINQINFGNGNRR